MNEVKIELYKWEGKFGPIKIKTNCGECSLNEKVIKSTIEDFKEESKYISLIEKPWLDNWYKVILKKAWHAPIIFINGKLIFQEKVISKEKLRHEIMLELYKNYQIPKGNHIYTIPNCKYCKKAKEILKRNNIKFEEHNIIEDSSDMIKLLNFITGKIHPITMPQIFFDGKWIKGADELEKLEMENNLK